MTAAAGPWSLEQVQERCALMREALLARGGATEAEIDPWAPGGAENADRSLSGWIEYWGYLKYLHGVETERDGKEGEKKEARAGAAALAALSGDPIPVTLHWVPEGTPAQGASLLIWPKGITALLELSILDWILTYFVAAEGVAEARGEREVMALAAAGAATAHGLILYGLTTPGYTLPWERWQRPDSPPAWTQDLDPIDALAVLAAHREVNGGRTRCLELLVKDGDGEHLSWAASIAWAADHAQMHAHRLMDTTSFEQLIVTKALAADVDRRIHDMARRRAGLS